MVRDSHLGHSWRGGSLVFPGFALDYAAMMRASLTLYEATRTTGYLGDARHWRNILVDEYRVGDTGVLAMTGERGERLVMRPQPTHDDAVPNANGVFAEALVRLAALTGDENDRRMAEQEIAMLAAVASTSPLSHTSILNALDLHLRGLTILVTGDRNGQLTRAALRIPYLDRTVCAVENVSALSDTHPGKAQTEFREGPQALVCAGMRCSLPSPTQANSSSGHRRCRDEVSQPNIPEAGGDPLSDQGEQVEPPWPSPLAQVWPCFAEFTRRVVGVVFRPDWLPAREKLPRGGSCSRAHTGRAGPGASTPEESRCPSSRKSCSFADEEPRHRRRAWNAIRLVLVLA